MTFYHNSLSQAQEVEASVDAAVLYFKSAVDAAVEAAEKSAERAASVAKQEVVQLYLMEQVRDLSERPLDGFTVALVRPQMDVSSPGDPATSNRIPSHQRKSFIDTILVGMPGPSGTIWEGGVYSFTMTYTDRMLPPICKYDPPLFHPNM